MCWIKFLNNSLHMQSLNKDIRKQSLHIQKSFFLDFSKCHSNHSFLNNPFDPISKVDTASLKETQVKRAAEYGTKNLSKMIKLIKLCPPLNFCIIYVFYCCRTLGVDHRKVNLYQTFIQHKLG